MSITSLSFTFVNMYAPPSAKPVAATETQAPPAAVEAEPCHEHRPGRQHRLVEAIMSALRELGVGGQETAPVPAPPAAVSGSPVAAAASAPGGTAPAAPGSGATAAAPAPVANATEATSATPTDAAPTVATAPATQAQPAAEPAPSVESAVHEFAHELFRALRHVGRGDSSDEDSGRVDGPHGHRGHHEHRHWREHGYGDLSQRLDALSHTVGSGDDSANSPLLDAFSSLFNAIKPPSTATSSTATSDTDMAAKLSTFLQTMSEALRPDAMDGVQTPQAGSLVNVTA